MYCIYYVGILIYYYIILWPVFFIQENRKITTNILHFVEEKTSCRRSTICQNAEHPLHSRLPILKQIRRGWRPWVKVVRPTGEFWEHMYRVQIILLYTRIIMLSFCGVTLLLFRYGTYTYHMYMDAWRPTPRGDTKTTREISIGWSVDRYYCMHHILFYTAAWRLPHTCHRLTNTV